MLVIVVGGFYIWSAYRKAKQKGKNPFKWAAIAGAVFIATQIITVSVFAVVFRLKDGERVWFDNLFRSYSLQITIVALLASIFTNWLFLQRPLDRVRKESFTEPPPPPTFDH